MSNIRPMGNKGHQIGNIFPPGRILGTRKISSGIMVSFRDPGKCLYSIIMITGYPVSKRCSIFGFLKVIKLSQEKSKATRIVKSEPDLFH